MRVPQTLKTLKINDPVVRKPAETTGMKDLICCLSAGELFLQRKTKLSLSALHLQS